MGKNWVWGHFSYFSANFFPIFRGRFFLFFSHFGPQARNGVCTRANRIPTLGDSPGDSFLTFGAENVCSHPVAHRVLQRGPRGRQFCFTCKSPSDPFFKAIELASSALRLANPWRAVWVSCQETIKTRSLLKLFKIPLHTKRSPNQFQNYFGSVIPPPKLPNIIPKAIR